MEHDDPEEAHELANLIAEAAERDQNPSPGPGPGPGPGPKALTLALTVAPTSHRHPRAGRPKRILSMLLRPHRTRRTRRTRRTLALAPALATPCLALTLTPRLARTLSRRWRARQRTCRSSRGAARSGTPRRGATSAPSSTARTSSWWLTALPGVPGAAGWSRCARRRNPTWRRL